jgi:hypothetical protein
MQEKWPSTLEDFSEQLKAKVELQKNKAKIAENLKKSALLDLEETSKNFLKDIVPYLCEYVKILNYEGDEPLYFEINKLFLFEFTYYSSIDYCTIKILDKEQTVIQIEKRKDNLFINDSESYPHEIISAIQDISKIFEGQWLKAEIIKELLSKVEAYCE